MMTLLDAASPSADNLICVAFRHQFDILSERTGEVLTSHVVDATRIIFVDALRLADDVDAHSQLLLCYNSKDVIDLKVSNLRCLKSKAIFSAILSVQPW